MHSGEAEAPEDVLQAQISNQSQTIDLARLFLIFLVVSHHVGDRVAPALPDFNLFDILSPLHFTGDDFYLLFRAFFDTMMGNTGFFLISGYLFFFNVKTWNAAAYIGKLRKRVFTVLIPYFLWNLIAACTRVPSLWAGDNLLDRSGGGGRVQEYFQAVADKGFLSIFWNFNVWDEANTNALGWPMPSFGPVCIPLWFLQSLLFLALASPIIHFIARRLGIFGVSVLAVLYFTEIWFSVPGFSISAIFYFTLGAYFAVRGKNMVYTLRRHGIALFALAVLSFAASITIKYGRLEIFNYAKGVFTLTATATALVIISHLIEKRILRQNKELSKSVFFIYASHAALLIVTATGVLYEIITFHSKAWYTLAIGYIAVPAATMCLCYAVHRALRRIMPSVAKPLAGNK